ncbi:hypothetical protein AVEN_64510-1, partial [Araneus ventricosus]
MPRLKRKAVVHTTKSEDAESGTVCTFKGCGYDPDRTFHIRFHENTDSFPRQAVTRKAKFCYQLEKYMVINSVMANEK